MLPGDDEVYLVTSEQADRQRRSECEDLQRQLLHLEREHRLLQDEHVTLEAMCERRLAALERIAALDEPDNVDRRTVTLNQIINRVRGTLGRSEEVN